jgi:hypothetical protein
MTASPPMVPPAIAAAFVCCVESGAALGLTYVIEIDGEAAEFVASEGNTGSELSNEALAEKEPPAESDAADSPDVAGSGPVGAIELAIA